MRMSVIFSSSLRRFPGAETTTTVRSSDCLTISATFFICPASARELPPNLHTIITAPPFPSAQSLTERSRQRLNPQPCHIPDDDIEMLELPDCLTHRLLS